MDARNILLSEASRPCVPTGSYVVAIELELIMSSRSMKMCQHRTRVMVLT
jgi:hypothetical protein